LRRIARVAETRGRRPQCITWNHHRRRRVDHLGRRIGPSSGCDVPYLRISAAPERM